jgi:quinoprotein relay system zinc metallohydrolase 2
LPYVASALRRFVFGTLCHLVVTPWCLGALAAVPGDDDPLQVQQLAPGVFVHFGRQETSSAENHGDIANIGFIVGERCVAVVDSGGSPRIGRRLRLALRAATAVPVCYVINTHMHPDHILGNAAFLDTPLPVFVGHARLAAAVASRSDIYRRGLSRDTGEDVAAADIVLPTRLVSESADLELDLGGRKLQVRAWPTAHTDNDLSIFDQDSGTLWLADLLFVDHTPVVDGSLRGWLAVLPEIARLQPRRVVSGHGRASDWRKAMAQQEHYLRLLLDETRSAIAAGLSLAQAVDSVGRTEREHWLLFDEFHRRNVTAAFAELEWEN